MSDVDQFKEVDFNWTPGKSEFAVLKDVPEKAIKELLCGLFGEATIDKDWGGEECDVFSSNLLLDGKRRTAAFLLKGPSTFHEMTLADCGKNGDQIYRLFNIPADVGVVQHCHKIGAAVRETVEVFALTKFSATCRYLFIDGYDSARILRAHGKLPVVAKLNGNRKKTRGP